MKINFTLTLKSQRGLALIVSLVFMLLVSVLAISVLKSNVMLEKVAGNTREKQRAFQMAQDALSYGENWLTKTTVTTPSSCAGGSLASLTICSETADSISTAALVSLPFVNYLPNNGDGSSGANGGSAGDINYSQRPGVYIASLGSNAYQVTAIGYGGTIGPTSTVVVLQSVVHLGSSVSPISDTKQL